MFYYLYPKEFLWDKKDYGEFNRWQLIERVSLFVTTCLSVPYANLVPCVTNGSLSENSIRFVKRRCCFVKVVNLDKASF